MAASSVVVVSSDLQRAQRLLHAEQGGGADGGRLQGLQRRQAQAHHQAELADRVTRCEMVCGGEGGCARVCEAACVRACGSVSVRECVGVCA